MEITNHALSNSLKLNTQIDLRHINQPDVNSTALANSSNQIDIGIDLSDFLLNVEWDVMAVPATRRERSYECCSGAFQGEWLRSFWCCRYF